MKCGNCHQDHGTVAEVRSCYSGVSVDVEALSAEVTRQAERYHFAVGNLSAKEQEERFADLQGAIAKYEEVTEAAAALVPAGRPFSGPTTVEPVWSDRTPRGSRTPVPSEFVAPAPRPERATEKQINYLNKLLDERPAYREVENLFPDVVEKMGKRDISRKIEEVLKTPKEKPAGGTGRTGDGLNEILANVPDCYVALPSRSGNNDLDFIRIGTNQGRENPARKGWRRVQRIVGGQAPISLRIGEAIPFARAIAAMNEDELKAAQVLFGREIGRCGVCGKTLTDETSRRFGIGPVCREAF